MQRETRAFTVDSLKVEKREDKPVKLRGHAAVFNSVTDIGGYFREQIKPGAFADSLKSDDIRSLVNHDSNMVIGRNRAGTLKLEEDDRGLAVEITLPDTTYARDLAESINRGDISGMSFGFMTRKDSWDYTADPPLRTLEQVTVFEVSPVVFPAYSQTDIGVRSADDLRGLVEKNRPKPSRTPSLLRELEIECVS